MCVYFILFRVFILITNEVVQLIFLIKRDFTNSTASDNFASFKKISFWQH